MVLFQQRGKELLFLAESDSAFGRFAAALVNDLQLAKRKLTLSDLTTKFVKLDLLVLDELGFIAVDQEGAQLRLTHRGHVLEFAGESYRYRNRLHQDSGANGEETDHTGERRN